MDRTFVRLESLRIVTYHVKMRTVAVEYGVLTHSSLLRFIKEFLLLDVFVSKPVLCGGYVSHKAERGLRGTVRVQV